MESLNEKFLPGPRPDATPAKALEVGDVIQTAAGERRRATLPDGSVLYVNQNTKVRLAEDRKVQLDMGEVFVEVSPAAPNQSGATFTVLAPDKTFTAFGTKFAVQADPRGSDLLVSQGKVKVEGQGAEMVVPHGNILHDARRNAADAKPGTAAVTPAERVTHVLDWTRDLMSEADSVLVPASQFDGGALIAVDTNGQEAKLSLRNYHVDVHVEDGFARTTIDQTYFNHHPWRLEGTFYFPLPPDASLSRLAMYVDGHLMEGGMAEREYAQQVYNRIVNSQRDPALLEWVDGTTFKMRVFPLEGRQEKRIVLSYTQRLPTLYGKTQYRFPAGHSLQVVNDWSFSARVKNGATLRAASPTHPRMKIAPDGRDLVLTAEAQRARVDQDVVLDLASAAATPDEPVRYSRADQDGKSYLLLRFRPELRTAAKSERRDWIILFESSADRDPLLARVQIEIVRTLLNNAEHDDTFRVLTAGTTVHAFADDAVPATPNRVNAAMAFLDRTHLVGALDLGRAFAAVGDAAKQSQNPYLVHVGSGITHMGVLQTDLPDRIPKGIRYVGVGVGKHYDRNFMKQAAERTGGFYTQINPDEPITWRAFDLLATLNTPRLMNVQVGDKNQDADENKQMRFLVDNPSISQGEEICAIARLVPPDGPEGKGKPRVPESLVVTGLLDGKPYREEVAVTNAAGGADYLPRTWAKLEIDRLLALNLPDNQQRIIELSKAMYVMTPFTSLLVLENEEMYREFKVDRGRKDHWALYPCADTIPVVYEPDPTQPVDVRNAPKGAKPGANQVLQTMLVRVPARWLDCGNDRSQNRGTVLTAVQVYSGAYGLPENDEGFLGDRQKANLGRRAGDAGDVMLRAGRSMQRFGGQKSRELRDSLQVSDMVIPVDAEKKKELFSYRGLADFNGRFVDGERTRSDKSAAIRYSEYAIDVDRLPARQVRGISRPISNYFAETDGTHRWLKESAMRDATPEMFAQQQRVDDFGLKLAEPGAIFGKRKAGFTIQKQERLSELGFVPAEKPVMLTSGLERGIEEFEYRRSGRNAAHSSLYERIFFSNDQRLFTDLVGYAPGLNTSGADIEAALEAEAAPELRNAPGHIDPGARQLIDQARKAGWRRFVPANGKDVTGESLTFDGSGRYVYERTLPLGLRETVVCDGDSLLHLYPELGLAARRSVSRFHRAELLSAVPWLTPPAEDLAHGADLEMTDAHTVAVVPHAVKNLKRVDGKLPGYVRMHLVFTADRLAERQIVAVEEGKITIVAREVYDGMGGVRRLDAEGREHAKSEQSLAAAKEPNLRPETQALVVLPLPLRTRQHVFAECNLDPNRALTDPENACYSYLGPDAALELLAALYAHGHADDARHVVRDCFLAHGDRRVGLFTILFASGVEVGDDPECVPALTAQADTPVARYLLLHGNHTYRELQERLPIHVSATVGQPDSFLRRVAEFYDLWLRDPNRAPRWLVPTAYRTDENHYTDFIQRNRANVLGWALLTHVQDNRGPHNGALYSRYWLWLTWQWDAIASDPPWPPLTKGGTGGVDDPNARYEQASCLANAGHVDEARTLFTALYRKDLKAGVLPAIDGRFRNALQAAGPRPDLWNPLMQQATDEFLKKDRRGAVVALATQCHQLGDRPLADNLMKRALAGLDDAGESLRAELQAIEEYRKLDPARQAEVLAGAVRDRQLRTTLLAVGHYRRLANTARAEELIDGLLNREAYVNLPGLWRLAATVADERGSTAKAVHCLERALDLEFADLPDVIDLQSWRTDYGRLLNHYRAVVGTAVMHPPGPPFQRGGEVAVHSPPYDGGAGGVPGDIAPRTIRAVDRWRKHDPEATGACQTASEILNLIGARAIAWEYLTTSVGRQPTNAGTWTELAQRLQRQGDFDTADRAYATATEANPKDALILWDRAQNKRQGGDVAGSNTILRQIAETKWDSYYDSVQANARWQLEQR